METRKASRSHRWRLEERQLHKSRLSPFQAAASVPAVFLRDLAILYMENNLDMYLQLLMNQNQNCVATVPVANPRVVLDGVWCVPPPNYILFGSDRSPRCQDVRVSVCLCDIMLKRTVKEFWRVKMSSSSILKHPGGFQGKQAGKQAGKCQSTHS